MTFDVLGNIAILKKEKGNKKKAEKLLKEHKNIKTVLEKKEKVKGRLRTLKTRWLAGEKSKEALYKENACIFRFNVEKCYFSPRLSEERKELGKKIKKARVLVMFAGVGPFSCVIAKNKKTRVTSIELGRECVKYAKENKKMNKLENLEILQGDVKKVIPGLKSKFDVIVMPRPQLRDSFLKQAFSVCKKGTLIYYYDFGKEKNMIKEKILKEARKNKKKIKILKIKKAGELAPYKFRWRVDFRIL